MSTLLALVCIAVGYGVAMPVIAIKRALQRMKG